MKNQLLHTPEGVRDIYNDECEKKIILENKLLNVMKSYGYHPIQTPTFEFFDIFSKEIGTTPSKDLYKFFDKEGNTLVLRPDITPSIARAASKYFMEDAVPIRFCYNGNTFINNNSYQGRLKERTQSGAELVGDGSVDADAEILAMAARAISAAGLKKFQISVGHADFLTGLFEAAELDEDMESEIRELILNRNFYGVEEVIAGLSLDENLVYLFELLKDVMLTKEKIEEARKRALDYPKISHALERLVQLDELLELYKIHQYVTYELGMLSRYDYYTGIIFAGYTFGSGEAIVAGGRYDNLLKAFGKSSPSIGFAIIIDQLMEAQKRQNIYIPFENTTKWMVYTEKYRSDVIKDAEVLRSRGEKVELMPITEDMPKEVYESYAEKNHIQDIIYFV